MAKGDQSQDIPHERKEPRPDFSEPLPRKKLPEALQNTLDNEENLWEVLYEGKGGDSTDSNVRYAAYASRFRTILVSAQRYVAYTSDIGESFRPVAHPNWVRAAYGVSWAYLIGDVSYEGYKAYEQNQKVLNPVAAMAKQADPVAKSQALADAHTRESGGGAVQLQAGRVCALDDYRTVMAQRAVFQSIASMGLPAFTIHSIVRYSGRALKDAKNKTIRTWGPIGLGLAAVPFLPFIFDKPIEHAVEWTFHKGFELVGGPSAVNTKTPVAKPVGAGRTPKEKEL